DVGALLVVEPAHVDGPVDDVAVADERMRPFAETNRHDLEVRARREPTIDPDFVETGPLSSLDRREVEEGQPNGLLDLVDLGPDEHPRDVGLDEAHLSPVPDRVRSVAELDEQLFEHGLAVARESVRR